mgnify:CR=1 FL=1
MTTAIQRTAAKTNIRKAQAAWASMSSRQHAVAQPEGRARKKPGTGGEGNYFHVEVRRSDDFVTFRTQDVGEPGHIQRVERSGKGAVGTRLSAGPPQGRHIRSQATAQRCGK